MTSGRPAFFDRPEVSFSNFRTGPSLRNAERERRHCYFEPSLSAIISPLPTMDNPLHFQRIHAIYLPY